MEDLIDMFVTLRKWASTKPSVSQEVINVFGILDNYLRERTEEISREVNQMDNEILERIREDQASKMFILKQADNELFIMENSLEQFLRELGFDDPM
jgi:hypothetical protein